MSDLVEKLSQRRARVGVVGLGYVGLPLAASFADAGYDVIGFEVDESSVGYYASLYILDVEAEDVDRLCVGKLATTNLLVWPNVTPSVYVSQPAAKDTRSRSHLHRVQRRRSHGICELVSSSFWKVQPIPEPQ